VAVGKARTISYQYFSAPRIVFSVRVHRSVGASGDSSRHSRLPTTSVATVAGPDHVESVEFPRSSEYVHFRARVSRKIEETLVLRSVDVGGRTAVKVSFRVKASYAGADA